MVIPTRPGTFAYRCFVCGHRWTIAADADLRRFPRTSDLNDDLPQFLRQKNRRLR